MWRNGEKLGGGGVHGIHFGLAVRTQIEKGCRVKYFISSI